MEQQNLVPTEATAWKGRLNVSGTPLELPSGNVALVKQISPMAFLDSGLIPDPLRPTIFKMINDKKGMRPRDVEKMIEDPKKLAGAMQLMDQTICHVVLQPEIMMPPKCKQCSEYAQDPAHDKQQPTFNHSYQEGERDPGVLYADEVDMTDKQFVFQWVLGGTKALEPFREELAASVGSLLPGEELQEPAK